MNYMLCPACRSARSYVLETREIPNGLRRRRRCEDCKVKFSTIEKVMPENSRLAEPMVFVPAGAIAACIADLQRLVLESPAISEPDPKVPA